MDAPMCKLYINGRGVLLGGGSATAATARTGAVCGYTRHQRRAGVMR